MKKRFAYLFFILILSFHCQKNYPYISLSTPMIWDPLPFRHIFTLVVTYPFSPRYFFHIYSQLYDQVWHLRLSSSYIILYWITLVTALFPCARSYGDIDSVLCGQVWHLIFLCGVATDGLWAVSNSGKRDGSFRLSCGGDDWPSCHPNDQLLGKGKWRYYLSYW